MKELWSIQFLLKNLFLTHRYGFVLSAYSLLFDQMCYSNTFYFLWFYYFFVLIYFYISFYFSFHIALKLKMRLYPTVKPWHKIHHNAALWGSTEASTATRDSAMFHKRPRSQIRKQSELGNFYQPLKLTDGQSKNNALTTSVHRCSSEKGNAVLQP